MLEKEKRRYIVHFVGDVYNGKPDIEYIVAESVREAAKLFFLNYAKDYDCRIQADEEVFSASELFPERNLIPLEKEIFRSGSKLNFDKLDQHSKDILFEIYKQFPDWLALAENEKEWEERFTIEWPSPYPGNPTMWVSTAWGDYEDFVVGFGGEHRHMQYDHKELVTFEGWVKKANEYLEKIKSEELICYETGGFWGGTDLNNLEFVKEILNKGKLKKAYSWLGTYNYPK
ncbi:MAG: hypothetical protein IPM14_01695 [bacterium]|nr:hypothetical protein [bacterium]